MAPRDNGARIQAVTKASGGVMPRIRIVGGHRLAGEISICGAKNAALPLMTAALLTNEPLTLLNLPQLADIATLSSLLAHHGVEIEVKVAARPIGAVATCRRKSPIRRHPTTSSGRCARCSSSRPTACTLRRRTRLATGRLCDRHASRGLAPEGVAATGCRDRTRSRLY